MQQKLEHRAQMTVAKTVVVGDCNSQLDGSGGGR